ncbi:MAG: branched-chain amino acid ABC transporter permease [Acidobacteria bacterium]|jgi:branched-chain amino acid transport system permease protein|nr:branched-chain amino acid ABC transporter permease [Acidobacteriota bacterium]MEB2350038.1 branched-chain amino acid ABC transporter permease [Burkholderiaceae bacterium]
MAVVTLSRRQARALEVLFWLAIASCFFVLPLRLSLLSQILIFGLFAVSLDIALGYAGILTVGHAAFFGSGAYAAGLLARHGWGEPFSGLLLAFAVCALLGWLLSFLVVRGTDLTRLMITVGICVLLGESANQLTGLTGGADGLQGVEMWPVLGLFGFDLYGKTAFVYSLVVVFGVFMLVRRILGSPFGLALRGIHDSPKRMLAIGSPVGSRLRMAYTISAGGAGIAGALLAQTSQFVGIGTLSFDRSAEVLIILVLGGTGRLYGGLVGALVYMLVHEVFSDLDPKFWMFWLGAFLIAVVTIGRGGILGWCSRLVMVQRR